MAQPSCIATVQASLVQAADSQITRVVAMVDAMTQRGEADALLQPLRARLAVMRPERPLAFRRLLFTPVDALIVPSDHWQRGGPNVPRSALVPLATAIEVAIPQALLSVVSPDRSGAALAKAGGPLWPVAAAAIDPQAVPDDWARLTGLTKADFLDIASGVAAVLHCATAITSLAEVASPPAEGALLAILRSSQRHGAAGITAVTATLLARLPCHAATIAAARVVSGAIATELTVKAAEHELHRMETSITEAEAQDAATVAHAAARIAGLLDSLTSGVGHHPECRGRIDALRRQADSACRRQFTQLTGHLAVFAAGELAVDVAASTELVNQMERDARTLRRLEQAGRRLGFPDHYDDALKTAAQGMLALEFPSVNHVDRVRLAELLGGTEQAMTLLNDMKVSHKSGHSLIR